jgi:hypothetical protein
MSAVDQLKVLLESEDFENIYINYLPEIPQRIVLMEEPSGRIEPTQSVVRSGISIYVRDTKPSVAKTTIENIFVFLNSYSGKPNPSSDIVFSRISTLNRPQFWGYNEQTKGTEYMYNISVLYIDKSLTRN